MSQVNRMTLQVEGRTFVQEPPTFEQELYIMEQVVESGLDTIGPDLQLDPDSKDLTPVVKKMLVQAYKSGALFRLMGALLVEEGEEWSPELAEAQADLFRKTRDPLAKAALQPALVGAIMAFFESSSSSVPNSPISSDAPTAPAIAVDLREPLLSEAQAEAVFRTGVLKPSSAKSPSITGSTRKPSSGGRSATGSLRARTSGGK